MFGKKSCKRCKEKVSEKYVFCPHCGSLINKNVRKQDLGMLGEEDFGNEFEEFQESIFGGVGGKMIGKMFEKAVKMLEKEIEKERKNQNSMGDPKTNFQLFINGKRVDGLNGKSQGNQNSGKSKKLKKIPMDLNLPKNELEGFSALPKGEPKTNVRRLSDKVIYEINIPGVKSLKDVSMTRLENNLEIRARTKNKAYSKMIPVNFPIIDYNFSKGKLLIEMDSRE